MNTEHTTEAWNAYQATGDTGSNLWYVRFSDGLGGSMHGYCGEKRARLIAAAPELLEALKAQERHEAAKRNLEAVDQLHPSRLALKIEAERTASIAAIMRKAAIAKAEGKA